MAQNTEKSSELKESLILAKDVFKHLVLEGRRATANGITTVAEKIDITKEQESFINKIHQKLEQKARDRKNAKLQTATA